MLLSISTELYSQEIKVLIESDFSGTSPAQNTPWTNTSTLDGSIKITQGWMLGAGVIPGAGNNVLDFSVTMPEFPNNTLEYAIKNNIYFSLKIQNTGTLINLNRAEIEFGINRIGFHSPRKYAVFTSIGGFAEGNEAFVGEINVDKVDAKIKGNLPGTGYDNINSEVEIRIYLFEAQYAGHNAHFTSFKLSNGDLEAPTSPQNLTAIAPNSYSVSLNWEESTDNVSVVRYDIYENDVFLSSTTKTSFSAGAYIANTTVSFTVKAADTAGNISDSSNKVTVKTPEAVYDNERSPIGTNLSGIADWSTEHQFINLFKQSRFWGEVNAPWIHFDGKDGRPTAAEMVSADGYLQAGKIGSVIVMANDTWPVKGVDYVCRWEGTATVEIYVAGKKTGTLQSPGRIVFSVPTDVEAGSLQVRVLANSSTNPFSNAWLSELQYEDNYSDQLNPDNIFYPVLTSNWEAFKSIRFMDWMATNDSKVSDWRNTGDYQSTSASGINDFAYAWKGVPVEVMVKLSNKINVEPWFCIPHLATDDYITQFATIVNRNLNPNLKSYIEYSNECWNWQFHQTHYCLDEGKKVWGDDLSYAKYYAKQSINMFEKFSNVFTDNNRLVRVFAWQAAGNPKIFLDLEYGEWTGKAYSQADVIAIAPYFAGDLDSRGVTGDGSPALNMTVDEILDHCEAYIQKENTSWMNNYSVIAEDRNLSFYGYEGGQHLVADRADLVMPLDSTAILLDKFTQANDNPRMKEIYTQYLNMWKDNGGELFCNFSSVGPHSKYGHWGAKVYENQLRSDAPKYDALLTFIENNEIWFPKEPSLGDELDNIVNDNVKVYPIPSTDYLIIENPIADEFTIMLFDVTGNLVLQQEVNEGKVEVSTSDFDKGVYFLSINSNENNKVIKILIQ